MKKWEDFESEMTEFLQQMLKDYDVLVKQYGGSDSTVSDIEITINSNGKKFYVETKMPISQTSQFVVEIKDNKFVYGGKNKYESNKYSEEIINILNKNFKLYSSVSQSGMCVPISDKVAFDWIVSNMKNKNIEFVISVDNDGVKRIFSLDHLNQIFKVKTIFRRKKSGSQDLPKTYYNDFKRCLYLKFSKYRYSLKTCGKKLVLDMPLCLNKSDCYIDSDILSEGKRYFLSNKGKGKYEVKMTSLTNNPNIIFELSLKDNFDFDMYTIKCLIEYINNNM